MEKDHTLTRRRFVAGSLAAGFALAVRPLSALTISTNSAGLLAEEIDIPVAGKRMKGYWAAPEGKRNLPTLLVCHEIFGVHEHIRDVCRRFAKLGFLAVAPDLYHRQGDPTQIKEVSDILSKV